MSEASIRAWRPTKFKFVGEIISGGTPVSGTPEYWDGPIPWLTPVDLGKHGSSAIGGSARTITHAGVVAARLDLLPPGSIVISTRAPIGSVGLLTCEATTNQGCKAILPGAGFDSKFAYYFALDAAPTLQSLGLGTTFLELSTYALKNSKLDLPAVLEQRRIVEYLDELTGRIDRLMGLRRRQMELLREQRAALIQQAVTRGIDPNAHLKDSGLPWLGQIPEHWELKRLKWVASLQRGYDLPDQLRVEGEVPVVTSGGVVATHNYAPTKGPGVVTGRYGSTGNVFYLDVDFWPHNTALFVSNFHGNQARFVYYLMQTLNYDMHSAKSAVPGVDRKDLHETFVVVPPVNEQEDIVLFIESESAKIAALLSAYSRQLTLLAEYRSALIHECVTGQRRIGEDVAQLAR